MAWEMTESSVVALLKWVLGHLSFDLSLVEIISAVVHLSTVILFLLLPTAVMANELQDAFESKTIEDMIRAKMT